METAILEPNLGTSTVTRAALGDEVAFARLIDEYHEPMVRATYVVVGDVELAREAAQNAWIIAWKRLSSLREPERVRSWLVATCANEARQLTRRNKRQKLVEASRDPSAPDTGDPVDPDDPPPPSAADGSWPRPVRMLSSRHVWRDMSGRRRHVVGPSGP